MSKREDRLLLLITDEPAQCRLISALAAREGWRTISAGDADAAVAAIGTRQAMGLGAIVIDRCAFGGGASALVGALRAHRPELPILMLIDSNSPLLAVEAMRAGAFDYLRKPVAPDRLIHALRSARVRNPHYEELTPLAEKLPSPLEFEAMIGAAPTFRAALAVAARAARGDGPVLVEGERGTGKEMLVRAIHAASSRAKASLHIVNLGAVPANSIETELFGHEPNAFPGAFERQVGALLRSDGGTLVIDDIERLPRFVQDRLLGAIRHSSVRPIGAQHAVPVDVRLIAASNMPLADLVAEGLFHPELFAAMASVSVALPPLRERTRDISALARHFLARISDQSGLRELAITDGALRLLAAYDWPGNVRQLRDALFRATVFCDGDTLTAADFPQLSALLGCSAPIADISPAEGSTSVTLYTADGNLRPLEDLEADVIRLAIGHYQGRMSEVARRLGIGRSTLYRRLDELGLNKDPGTPAIPPLQLFAGGRQR